MRWGLTVAMVLTAAATAAAQPAVMPTTAERQLLARGDVVYRVGAALRDGVAVPGARGGIAFVRVATSPEPVWSLLTRPERYPEIFPGLRAVEVLESEPGTWLLRTEGKVGPFTFRYHTRHHARPDDWTLVWRLDPTRDNDVFDDHWGFCRLQPEGGATLVVYAIGSIPSSWQPLAGFFERRGIVQAMTALREAASRRAGATRAPTDRSVVVP
jgi:uncharacterized protein YndB with AHSA1/START domain